MSSPDAVNVCLGGYRGFVAALSLCTESDGLLALEAQFAQKTHASTVTSISVAADTLISGGKDDTVHVYDVTHRIERKTLFAHKSDVNVATLFSDSSGHAHALTGDATGALCLWRARDWRLLKTLHAHNAPLLAAAVHPSARLALSTASDRAVLMWDLARGKAVFSAKTKGASASRAAWAADGDTYVLAAGNIASLSYVDGRPARALAHDKPVGDVAFLAGEKQTALVTGADDGIVRIWDSRAAAVQRIGSKHDRKVIGVASVGDFVISADIKGGLKVWDLRAGDEPRLETTFGSGDVHFTCMAAAAAVKGDEEAREPRRKRRKKRSIAEVHVDADGVDVDAVVEAQEEKDVKSNGGEEGLGSKKKTRRRRKKKNDVANA